LEQAESVYCRAFATNLVKLMLRSIMLADETKNAFDKALVDSVTAALDALGPTVKESIFLLLQRRNSISPDRIPQLVGEFVKALQDILGPTSRVVEKLIIAGLIARKQVPANVAQGRRLLEVVGAVRLSQVSQS
jgi:hypothetical protein